MDRTKLLKDLNLWFSIIILLMTAYFSVATFLRWFNLRFQVGPLSFTHWLGWIGSLFIVFFTPIYYILKRRNSKLVKTLIKVHVFGNLLSFMFISIHFAQQMGRPAQFYPDLGTGLILYIVMFILVTTGFFHRFGLLKKFGRFSLLLPHQNRYLHVAITLTFYIVIIVHVLQNMGIL